MCVLETCQLFIFEATRIAISKVLARKRTKIIYLRCRSNNFSYVFQAYSEAMGHINRLFCNDAQERCLCSTHIKKEFQADELLTGMHQNETFAINNHR